MTRVRATRPIAADPTSTALLLAGPTALDLWPGARRGDEVAGGVLVVADLPGPRSGSTAVIVRAQPPRRTPVSFVTRFSWQGSDLPAVDGSLTLLYDGPHATRAVLELDASGDVASRGLPAMAEGFLANLAAAAEARAYAA